MKNKYTKAICFRLHYFRIAEKLCKRFGNISELPNRPSAKANGRHVSKGNVYTSSLFAEFWCHVTTNYTNFEMHTGK